MWELSFLTPWPNRIFLKKFPGQKAILKVLQLEQNNSAKTCLPFFFFRKNLLPTYTHQLSVSGRHGFSVLHIFKDLIVEYIHTCQNMCDSSCYISNYSKITDAAVSQVCSTTSPTIFEHSKYLSKRERKPVFPKYPTTTYYKVSKQHFKIIQEQIKTNQILQDDFEEKANCPPLPHPKLNPLLT